MQIPRCFVVMAEDSERLGQVSVDTFHLRVGLRVISSTVDLLDSHAGTHSSHNLVDKLWTVVAENTRYATMRHHDVVVNCVCDLLGRCGLNWNKMKPPCKSIDASQDFTVTTIGYET